MIETSSDCMMKVHNIFTDICHKCTVIKTSSNKSD